ncbi:S8 family peptidase [Hymenobacter psoromatis]|uniref:S8 family peptidase n=1 Tax=Hymenobacter psoromatis TaxID=1484116 RepID=UPI001CBB4750|nr:S8 family peptidase [Hymenobacter psoromatis]
MKLSFTLLLLSLLLEFNSAGAQAPPTRPGLLVVKLRAGAGAPAAELPALQAALQTLRATSLTQKFPRSLAPSPEQPAAVDLRRVFELSVPPEVSLAKARAVLLATGVVEYVEPLYVRQPLYLPNDPLADSTAGKQYYLRLTQAYRAWDFMKGDTSVVIGMTDTGIRFTHEDLRRQVKYNYVDPINGIDDDGDGYIDNFYGWDFSNNNNDPRANDDNAVHGTETSGVAAGQADNGLGIAGVGFNTKFLPLQIFPGTTTGAFAGFEAIVYAADHGCRVINMSWGGAGGYSRFEQDVCTYAAVNRDVVLVAAAGNTPADLLFYPASYDHVLSITATDAADAKAGFSTYSHRVDLAAPGVAIISALGSKNGSVDADYNYNTGTSLAAPQVTGAAALVRAHFPQLNAEQVQAQIRQAADTSMYQVPANAAYRGYLGTGRLNVARAVAALTQREARIVSSTIAPARPSGYAPGDTLRLAVQVRNLLGPVAGLSVRLISLSPYLTVRAGSFAVGSLATLAEATNEAAPFRLAVAAGGIPVNTKATLRYDLAGEAGYRSTQYLELLLNPDYVQLNVGDLSLSLTGRGNLGYDDITATVGQGVSYRASTPLLSEGGLLLATTPTRVADHLRSTTGAARQSFFELMQVARMAPGPRADQEARGTFRDSLPDPQRPRSVGVRVRQRGQSWAAPAALRDVILLDYSLLNLTADTLKPLYAGIFTDWDLPGTPGRNVARWDSVNRVSYAYDPLDPRVYAGVQVLGPRPAGVYAIDNNAPAGTPIYFGDGFSPAEKFLALSGGFNRAHREAGAAATGTDVSQVVSMLVPRLAPGDSTTVAFAVLAAPSLAELQGAAQAALAAYQQVLATARPAAPPGWQCYPNPAQSQLQVRMPASVGAATVQVFDSQGRLAAQAALPTGGGPVALAALPPGLYVVRVLAAAGSWTQRISHE